MAISELPTGTVTFLFTDIEGSTERWERDRSAMQAALARHNAILDRAIAAHRGRVFKTVGDAYCTAFAHASNAVASAIDAQRALHLERWDEIAPDFDPLHVRMGLHTGLVELKDGDYFGRPVNRVARLMSAGHGGQILVSLATQQLVRDALPKGCELVDLGVHRLKNLEHTEHIYRLVAPGMPDVDTPPDTAERLGAGERVALADFVADAACPYRGLHAFREEDARFFFGREVFTGRLVDALTHKPMVGVIGPSGSGKSSVVYAGMLPALQAVASNGSPQWSVLKLRPGAEPFHAVAGAVVPLLEGEMSETARLVETRRMAEALLDGTMGLTHVIDRARDKHADLGGLLFIVDQFEELYTLCPDVKVQRAFQDLLFETVHVASRGSPLKLALTLRADFMGHATAYRPFSDAIQDHNVILGPMNRDELGRVIARPAELQGRAFEPGLVERIMDDVGEEAGSLPLLEFALTKLWEGQQAGWLTHEAYEQIGRVDGAVARHADAVFDSLSADDQQRTRKVFVQMVRPGEGTEDTRRVAWKNELGDEGWAIVRRLADARLVVTDRDEAGRETAEVVHEALIRTWGRLTEWMGEDRRFRMWQERLRFAMRQWEESGRDEGALLRGVPLAEAEGWGEERGDQLSPGELDYVDRGIALRKQREREALERSRRRRELEAKARTRLQSMLGIAVAAAAMGALLAWLAWGARRESDASARIAKQLAVSAEARALDARGQNDLALALALDTVESGDAPLPSELTLSDIAYAIGGARRSVRAESDARSVVVSPDGKFVITGHIDGVVRQWDAGTGALIRELHGHSAAVTSLDVTEDSRRLVSAPGEEGAANNDVIMWDLGTGDAVGRLSGHASSHIQARLLPGDDQVLTGSTDRSVRQWSIADGAELRRMGPFDLPILSIDVDPKGRWFATAEGSRSISGSTNGRLRIWDLVSAVEVFRKDFDSTVYGVEFDPTGSVLAVRSGLPTPQLLFYDIDTWQLRDMLEGDSDAVFSFAPNGRNFITSTPLSLYDTVTMSAVRRLPSTPGYTNALAFTPAGDAVTTHSGGEIRFVRLGSPAETGRYSGHEAALQSAVYGPGDRTIVSASVDGTVRVWDRASGTEQLRLGGHGCIAPSASSPAQYRSDCQAHLHAAGGVRVFDAVVDHDRSIVYSGAGNGRWAAWGLESGALMRMVDGHANAIRGLSLSEDGDTLLTASTDGTLRGWDARSGEELWRILVDGLFYDVRQAADGRTIVATANAYEGFDLDRVWIREAEDNDGAPPILLQLNSESGQVIHDWVYGGRHSNVIALLASQGLAATANYDGDLIVVDLATGSVRHRMRLSGGVDGLRFSPDGRLLAASTDDGTASIVDVSTGAVIRRYPGHDSYSMSAAFNSDGSRLLTSGYDNLVREWVVHRDLDALVDWVRQERVIVPIDCEERRRYNTLRQCAEDGSEPDEGAPVISHPRDMGLVTDSNAEFAQPRDDLPIEGDSTSAVVYGRATPNGGIAALAASTDMMEWLNDVVFVGDEGEIALAGGGMTTGTFVAATDAVGASGRRNRVTVWDPFAAPAIDRTMMELPERVSALAAARDGTTLFIGSHGGEVVGIDVQTETEIYRRALGSPVTALALDDTSGRLIVGTPSGGWSLGTRPGDADEAFGVDLEGDAAWFNGVAITLGGRRIVTGAMDGSVRLWEPSANATLVESASLGPSGRAHGDAVRAVAVSDDGDLVFTAGQDGLAIGWDLATLEVTTRFEDHVGGVWAIEVSPDGKLLATSDENADVRLWDLSSGALRAMLDGHVGVRIRGLSFSPDGALLASAGDDRRSFVWDVSRYRSESQR